MQLSMDLLPATTESVDIPPSNILLLAAQSQRTMREEGRKYLINLHFYEIGRGKTLGSLSWDDGCTILKIVVNLSWT